MTFQERQQRAKREWEALQRSRQPLIMVGMATCGQSAGAGATLAALREELAARNLQGRVVEVGCVGLCYAEPLVTVALPEQPWVWYGGVTQEKVRRLVEEHLVGGTLVADWALGTTGEGSIAGVPALYDTPVLRPQVRRVLRNCGYTDPTNIDHYLAQDGYTGLMRALELGSEKIIAELRTAGLRGRGGAGFPTWRKWQFCIDAPGSPKYLVCNADEGDPGAFMNRSLLEGDPHSVIEGMLIGGYAIGAAKGYIYCRAEYPLALERLDIALRQARSYGLLGRSIGGSDFSFDIEVKEGAGAFVCGEETALIASIEGARGMPRPRPPFPAVSGLWGKPTVINNVETLANVALILQKGSDWYASLGTERSKGTKTFALVGKVKRSGLIEVPLGITLREIVFDIGGGILGDQEFKAVQTGGPSGGCLPASLLDSPVDYESLAAAGSIMGSGGMVVMDGSTCMVDVARYFLDFTQKESCGECVPCRLGTKQMLDILTDITHGKGRLGDVDLLQEVGQGVKRGSLCGLGQTAPNPVLTTIRYFGDEYRAHEAGRCPARVCRSLISYRIVAERCRGCQLCLRACPTGAITGKRREPHVIDLAQCIRCGVCLEVCPPKFRAVECVSGD
ncbi:MAG: NADH-ubiquinone oxidoreductase-F iron-sulfur binding region domain-containing protein [Anaerolineae bacterium]